MGNFSISNQPVSVAVVLLDTGDASKTLLAAAGSSPAENKWKLYKIGFNIETAAAQAVTISDGTTTLFVIPASHAVGFYEVDLGGVELATRAALTATPAAAGPKIRFRVIYSKVIV